MGDPIAASFANELLAIARGFKLPLKSVLEVMQD
jgi:hypothetical protein